MSPEDLANRFTHHPPRTPGVAETHARVRAELHRVAEFVNGTVPDGREKALVLTKLEEAMFWANAAIARDGE